MARIALWTFDEAPGSSDASDTEVSDGTAQDGTFENGATTNGSGAGVFDGSNDYVEVPDDPAFQLSSGSIVISFTQDTASVGDLPYGHNAAQTLFSRDSSGYDGGGHLSIYIKSDGSVGVRHQDESSSTNFEGGNVTLGQPTTVIYSWGPDGSQLIVDGVVVDSGTEALSLEGNNEPITIGASQAQSGDGVANNLKGFFDGQIDGVAIYDEPVEPTTIPCLVGGTHIETPSGPVPIEMLSVGDLVETLHHGPQPIRWIGVRQVQTSHGGDPRLHPIKIAAGALGQDLPKRDLYTSRQHRLVVSSRIAQRMVHASEVLVAARHLVGLPGVETDASERKLTYHHLLFDRHEIIFAEGAPTESLYAGQEALKSVPRETKAELLRLFPEMAALDAEAEAALPIPAGHQQKTLIRRHAQNNKPMLESFSGPDPHRMQTRIAS